jgi:hypothetical protein
MDQAKVKTYFCLALICFESLAEPDDSKGKGPRFLVAVRRLF